MSSHDDPYRWEERYQTGDIPWDSRQPDRHLQQVMASLDVPRGAALDIGCGTGAHALWLAGLGFDVVGLDLSPTAIAEAQAHASEAGVGCQLVTLDFLQEPPPGGPFDFVYDRGCFHTFDDPAERALFASRVAENLAPGGVWHSLIGSTDGPPRDTGPPRRSAVDILTAVEPHFEVLQWRATFWDEGHHKGARAWVMVARRRE